MKDRKEDIEVKLKSSDTGVEYYEKASASECELTKECHIRVWPRQKYAFAINLGAGFDFEGASDLCIGFRTDGGDVRYGKTLKSRTNQHRYTEAHVYADAALIGDEVSRTEVKVLPFEFMATDGVLRGKLEVIMQHGKENNRDFLEILSPNLPKRPKARTRTVLTSVAYTAHNDKSHVSRGPYQPEKSHWTPAKGDSGRELKFIFHYAAVLCREGKSCKDAFKWARASGFQTSSGLHDDCDDEEPMPTKRIKTEPADYEAFEKAPNEPTPVSEYSTQRITGNSIAELGMRREREKKKAEIRRQLREIELERKLAELED
ncbi:hypothetical protein KC345_g7182 [Hortaea werneckii]|nr:hypothetical protein KC345_g7182 [Hortaea werneckii]